MAIVAGLLAGQSSEAFSGNIFKINKALFYDEQVSALSTAVRIIPPIPVILTNLNTHSCKCVNVRADRWGDETKNQTDHSFCGCDDDDHHGG